MPSKASKLKQQPIEDLLGMQEQLNAELAPRIDMEIAELENRLQKLREYKQRMAGEPFTTKGKKIAPKYRNPSNHIETWAGRGMYPKWLEKELKKGKKLADFKIED